MIRPITSFWAPGWEAARLARVTTGQGSGGLPASPFHSTASLSQEILRWAAAGGPCGGGSAAPCLAFTDLDVPALDELAGVLALGVLSALRDVGGVPELTAAFAGSTSAWSGCSWVYCRRSGALCSSRLC
eukprot:10827520-Heterocapsa_arctica.AAC.1